MVFVKLLVDATLSLRWCEPDQVVRVSLSRRPGLRMIFLESLTGTPGEQLPET